MLTSKLLSKKRNFTKSVTQVLTDLISSTFKFPEIRRGSGAIAVSRDESMRPDLVASRIYSDQTKWDVLLKFNGISNPFSIKEGDFLSGIPYSSLEELYKDPLKISERSELNEVEFNPILNPATDRDKERLANLQKKVKNVLPPNINKPGDKNVKVKDGKLIFGEDVTTVNKNNCPVPISRNRLQTALLKDKLFI